MARICLAYLSQLEASAEASEIQKSFPLAMYCAKHWTSHAVAAKDHDADLQAAIVKFFSSDAYKTWCKLYGWSEAEAASPLYIAAHTGLSGVVEALTTLEQEKGRNTNKTEPKIEIKIEIEIETGNEKGNESAGENDYVDALHAACAWGHIMVTELLLRKVKASDVNAPSGQGETMLYAASGGGYVDIVELLLSKGAEVDAQGGTYGSALCVAALEGHEQVVKALACPCAQCAP